MLQDTQRKAFEDVAIIPLHIQTNIWASRRNFEHTARNDELTQREGETVPAAGWAQVQLEVSKIPG